jgi:hypothetical protein
VPPPPPAEPKEELPTPPAEPEEVPPPPPTEPEEVPPPPPEEVKRLKPPWRKVARQLVVRPFLRAPKVCHSDACFFSEDALRGFAESWKTGCSSCSPNTPWSVAYDRDGLCLQGQFLGWEAGERSGPPPSTTTTMTMAASTSPAPAPTDSDPKVGLLQRRLPLLN